MQKSAWKLVDGKLVKTRFIKVPAKNHTLATLCLKIIQQLVLARNQQLTQKEENRLKWLKFRTFGAGAAEDYARKSSINIDFIMRFFIFLVLFFYFIFFIKNNVNSTSSAWPSPLFPIHANLHSARLIQLWLKSGSKAGVTSGDPGFSTDKRSE